METKRCNEFRSLSLDVGPTANRLLGSLSAEEWPRWQPNIESVELPSGMVLYDTGSEMRHMYFPATATVSLTQLTDNGASTELVVVGNDGAVGITLILGGTTALTNAIVQTSGRGFRVRAGIVRERLAHSPDVAQLMLWYTQSVLTQMAQTVGCNKHHSIEQQLCRWLLLRLDRISGDEISVTQQMIANLLGVRRESVTVAAQFLQRLDLIHSVRGRIKILDRRGLEARACECYAAIKRESERGLPKPSCASSHRSHAGQNREARVSMPLSAPPPDARWRA